MNDNHQIVSNLKMYLQQQFSNVIKEVILFGSRAYGGAQEDSDYDVLIVLDKDYTPADEDAILDLCYDIDLKYNILLDVHLLSVTELNTPRGRQPIFKNALNAGIYA